MLKRILITVYTLLTITVLQAQATTNTNAVNVATKIAKKMQDSLQLTTVQKNQLYDVNMTLHNQKQAARVLYATTPTALNTKLQTIERTRDSLYLPILTNTEYIKYKQKKRNLVSNN